MFVVPVCLCLGIHCECGEFGGFLRPILFALMCEDKQYCSRYDCLGVFWGVFDSCMIALWLWWCLFVMLENMPIDSNICSAGLLFGDYIDFVNINLFDLPWWAQHFRDLGCPSTFVCKTSTLSNKKWQSKSLFGFKTRNTSAIWCCQKTRAHGCVSNSIHHMDDLLQFHGQLKASWSLPCNGMPWASSRRRNPCVWQKRRHQGSRLEGFVNSCRVLEVWFLNWLWIIQSCFYTKTYWPLGRWQAIQGLSIKTTARALHAPFRNYAAESDRDTISK